MDAERTLLDGIEHHKAGRLVDAHRLYRAVLAEHPDDADALHLLGMLAFQGGNLAGAAERIGRAVELRPNTFDFLLNYARVCRAMGRNDDAVSHLRRAVELNPANPVEVVVEFAQLLGATGRAAEGVAVLEPAVDRTPTGDGLATLAELLLAVDRRPDALRAAVSAVKVLPDSAQTHAVLGRVLERQGDVAAAVASYRRAVEIDPLPEALNNLGHALVRLGRPAEAVDPLRRAVAARPAFPEAHATLAAAHAAADRADDAVASYRTALEQSPRFAAAWEGLGKLLLDQREWAGAVAALGRLVALRPTAAAYADLATAHAAREELDDALAAMGRAVDLAPASADARRRLGDLLRWAGRLGPAVDAFAAAVAIDPANAAAGSGLLYTLLADDRTTPEAAFAAHVEWGRRHADPVPKLPPPTPDRSPDRRLRVGYVSPNFRGQAVMSFVLPVLRNHDRAAFEVFCYSDSTAAGDEVTRQVRLCADHFRRTGDLHDEGLARAIRHDGIDVLVELTGHIGGGRLLALARRPAPVQVSYVGYQGTTGVAAVDHVLTDDFTDPPGADRFYVERPWRLPTAFFAYDEPADAPPVRPLPSTITGRVTFGCLNQIAKATPTAVRLWARVLRSVPGSRIVLLTTRCRATNDRLLADFAAGGVTADRVQLLYRTGTYEYFERYNSIDLALDPAPFVGHTTTCDAAWMGVPTVTLAGTTYAHRYGGVVARHLGLAGLVVDSPDAYVEAAADLATDRGRLSGLRSTLRDAMRRSPLCDGRRFTRELEAAYRAMWQAAVTGGGRTG